MKARYLVALLVCGSGFAATEHDVILRLEHSAAAGGPYVEVAMGAEMMTNGRVNAGRVTNEAGFWRLSGELVPVASPSPSPTPAPVAPLVEVVAVNGGTLSRSWSTAVWVDGFVVGRFEVVGAEWVAVRDWAVLNGYDIGGRGTVGGADVPVSGVTWYDALKWCNALSEMSGLAPVYRVDGAVYRSGDYGGSIAPITVAAGNGWRLPTEVEWEWAAKGGGASQNYTFAGGNTVGEVAWYAVNAAGPMRVGLKRANEIGVYDMSGNVTEWTWDISQAGFPMRRMRSGSYVHSETAVRLARRSESMPEVVNAWVGLRVVRTP